MSHFFAYMGKMKYIKRWNIMRNTENENILEHSAQCAMIAHALCVIKNKLFGGNLDSDRVAVLALYHETSEVITGDLATPVKYFNHEITEAYKKIESLAEERISNMLPDEIRDEYSELITQPKDTAEHQIVKAADKICAYIKCIEESKAGNSEFRKAEIKIKADLRVICENGDFPEVNYFMENFISSFELSLDELN